MRRLALALYYVLSRPSRRLRDPDGAPLWVRTDDYIGSDIFLLGRYEIAEIGSLRAFVGDRLADTVLLDVGANIGNHVVALHDLFAHVVAIEPNPEVAAALRLNVLSRRLDDVTVVECGLGGEDALLPFELDPGNLGGAGFAVEGVSRAATPGVEPQVLRVRLGDEVVAEHVDPDRHLGLVKIDVEGLEEAVIDGLSGSLRRDRPLVAFEFNGERATDWFTGHHAFAGYRFVELGYGGALAPLNRVRNRPLIKLLDIVVGDRKRHPRPVMDRGRHHPMILAVPPDWSR
jgi:FkbM family methyltransferase